MSAPPPEGLVFTVYGVPKAKGSLRHIGGGRMIEQLEGSKPWREAVKTAAVDAVQQRQRDADPFTIPAGPVAVDAVFTFAKPKSAPKRRRIWPITRSSGDVDKLARNLLDALVDAWVLGDDSQVIDLRARKVFAGEHYRALTGPGASIVVRAIGEGETEWLAAA